MRIYVEGPCNGVTKIKFCCTEIAEDILLGRIKTRPWTNHGFGFRAGDYRLSHCGHCGAEIVTEKTNV